MSYQDDVLEKFEEELANLIDKYANIHLHSSDYLEAIRDRIQWEADSINDEIEEREEEEDE